MPISITLTHINFVMMKLHPKQNYKTLIPPPVKALSFSIPSFKPFDKAFTITELLPPARIIKISF